jgi:large subunit ribosomal protein L6
VSRIGKMPVPVPDGVEVTIEGSSFAVKGPKGEMSHEFHPQMSIKMDDGAILVERPNDEQFFRAMHGLTRALINNMVVGVTEGFSKTLEIVGTGYRAELQGENLVMSLGFSHPVIVKPPVGITFEVTPRSGLVTVRGYDKEMVGRIAANIRAWRPVEPYLGKGIRYQGELVRRKSGKTGQSV